MFSIVMNEQFLTNRLAAKVKAANKVNEIANALSSKLPAILAPWVGKKIVNADESLTQRFKTILLDAIKEFETDGARILISTRSSYSLRLIIEVDSYYSYEVKGEKRNSYERRDRCLYLMDLANHQIAEKICDMATVYRTDWTCDEVKEKTGKMNAAQASADSFKSQLEIMT